MPKTADAGKAERGGGYLVALVFLVFLVPRLFIASPVYFIALDEAKYLALARTFPALTLFNQQFYVVHPPLFPAFIRLFSLIFSDHTAGILISLLAALASFAVLVRLFRILGKGWHWIAVALIPLAVSPLHIPTSRVVYKDSLFFALFLISLYYFLRGLAAGGRGSYLLSGLAAVLCGLTSDLAAYLYPAFLLAWLILGRRGRGERAAACPPLILLAAQGMWIGIRWRIFSRNDFYPAGVDGLIENVRDFTLRSLFAPRYFPETARLFDFRLDLSRLGLHGNVFPLEGLADLPQFIYVAFYVFCALSALFILFSSLINVGATFRPAPIGSKIQSGARSGPDKGSGRGRPSHNELSTVRIFRRRGAADNAGLFFSLTLAVYSLPALLHPEPRFLLPVLPPLCYLFAEGISRLAGKGMRYAAPVLTALAAIGAVFYLNGHRHPVLTVRKEVESARTGEFLRGLPGDGIMAQVGYPPELVYLTDKRVVALPLAPEKLDSLIERYRVDYLVYGQRYWAPIDERFAHSVWCWPTIKYIRDHPEKYPLLKAIDEAYGGGENPDRVFIHKTVISNQ